MNAMKPPMCWLLLKYSSYERSEEEKSIKVPEGHWILEIKSSLQVESRETFYAKLECQSGLLKQSQVSERMRGVKTMDTSGGKDSEDPSRRAKHHCCHHQGHSGKVKGLSSTCSTKAPPASSPPAPAQPLPPLPAVHFPRAEPPGGAMCQHGPRIEDN